MGLSGLFTKSKKYGLLKAYIVAILARGCVPCARRISILDGLYAG